MSESGEGMSKEKKRREKVLQSKSIILMWPLGVLYLSCNYTVADLGGDPGVQRNPPFPQSVCIII